MPIWQLCANLLIPNCLRSNLSYSPLAALELNVNESYNLYFYRNEKSTIEMDFFIRDAKSLIPVEVKATDNATKSLSKLTAQDGKYPDIRYGIKLCNKNIGFNGKFYTFPYFLTFLLKRFLNTNSLTR